MTRASRFDLTEILREVLSEPRFDAPSESWWDRFLARLLAEALRLLGAVIEAVGGPVVAGFIALGLVGALTLFAATRLAGRRAALIEERLELARLLELGADPADFLRRARQACERGDHAAAIRLRFTGGVLAMGKDGRIRYEPGLTTGGIAAQVDDPAFSELADQFDAVAYGEKSAGEADDRRSEALWRMMRAPT